MNACFINAATTLDSAKCKIDAQWPFNYCFPAAALAPQTSTTSTTCEFFLCVSAPLSHRLSHQAFLTAALFSSVQADVRSNGFFLKYCFDHGAPFLRKQTWLLTNRKSSHSLTGHPICPLYGCNPPHESLKETPSYKKTEATETSTGCGSVYSLPELPSCHLSELHAALRSL